MISRALEVAGQLANDAAEVITATAGRGATPGATVSPYDWVTDTDRTLERHTRRVLTSELLWVVDPVDGTANYVAGLPWCGYSLALVDADGPLVGVIADPYQTQIYAAARGQGLRANGRPVEASAAADPELGLAGSLICFEISAAHSWDRLTPFVDNCRDAKVGLRVLGSSALAVTQVALGRAAAAVLHRYEIWDVAGALALAAEAGAWIGDLHGTEGSLPLDGLLVCTPEHVPAVKQLIPQPTI